MKFKNRLLLSFALLFSAFLAGDLVQVFFIGDSVTKAKQYLELKQSIEENISSADRAVLLLRTEVWDALFEKKSDRGQSIAELEELSRSFSQLLLGIARLDPDFTVRAENYIIDFKQYFLLGMSTLKNLDQKDVANFPSIQATLKSTQERLTAVLADLVTEAKNEYRDAQDMLSEATYSFMFFSILFLAVMGALALVISLFISRKLSRPVEILLDVVKEIERGEIKARVPLLDGGEFKALGKAINAMMDEIENHARDLEKRVEERTVSLKEKSDQLWLAEKMSALTILVSGMAHEINTPLGTSLTSTTFLKHKITELKNRLQPNDEVKETFGSIDEALSLTEHGLTKIANLIDQFKRVSTSHLSHERQSQYDLVQVLSDIVFHLKKDPEYKNLEFKTQFPESLNTNVHKGSLIQVISLLAQNASSHAYKYDKVGLVELDVDEEDDHIVISFRDFGQGVDEESLKHLFEPFFTTDRSKGHTGLGLYVVYNLVNLIFKGTINQYRVPGGGLEFIIKIKTIF